MQSGHINIDTAHLWLDEIAAELPEPLFTGLNGGICLLPNVKYNPLGRNGELLILGEYITNHNMGRYINIYFGSIAQAYPFVTPECFKDRLREVLLHEFTHHLESLAGEKDLVIEDMRFLRRYLANP